MNGILVFDKPKNITSHDVVSILRKKTGIKRIGHAGTLDPIATGVLVMGIGLGTKTFQYLVSDNKEYIATLKFGYETDTLDKTGKLTNKTDNIPEEADFLNSLTKFEGKIEQVPPKYSAIKLSGQKAYDLARKGIDFEINPRNVTINEIKFIEKISFDEYVIKVSCSSGTYIRSLIRDLGRNLNSFATMEDLIRTKSGKFKLEDSISKFNLDLMDKMELENKMIKVDDALDHFNKFIIPDTFYKKIINGVTYKRELNLEENTLLRIYCKNEFIGIGIYETKNTPQIRIEKMLRS